MLSSWSFGGHRRPGRRGSPFGAGRTRRGRLGCRGAVSLIAFVGVACGGLLLPPSTNPCSRGLQNGV